MSYKMGGKLFIFLVLNLTFCIISCGNNVYEQNNAHLDEATGQYVVTHPDTRENWLKCSLGQTWNEKTRQCEGEPTMFTCLEAMTACPDEFRLADNEDFATVLCNYSNMMIEECPQDHYDTCAECSICDSMFPGDSGEFISDNMDLFEEGVCQIRMFNFKTGCILWDAVPNDQAYFNVRCVKM